MVLVDTSVWISLFRRSRSRVGERIWQITARDEAAVCGQVWVEFIGGFRATEKRHAYADEMRAYQWLDTSREACELAAEWCASLQDIGPGDALIAATAFTHGAALLTLDAGFTNLADEGLRVELVR